MNTLTEMLSRLTLGRALLVGVVVAAFYYFLVFDSGANLIQAQAQSAARITELSAQIDRDQQKLDAAAVYKKTAAEVGSTINKLLSLIPEQFGMADLMRIVSEEAKVAGSSLATIEPKTTSVSAIAKEFEEVVVSVDLSGSFIQHMVFLSNLTKINQILIVRKLTLNSEREAKGDEPPLINLKAEIVAFRYSGGAKPQGTGQ